MTKRQKKRGVEIQEAIRRILWEDWDPIGINDCAPDDEYDSYLGGIYRLLVSDTSEHQIQEALKQYEKNSMGLELTHRNDGRIKVARKLMEIEGIR